MKYNSEEEFLKNYDITKFKQLSLTVDILILSVSEEDTGNYRKKNKQKISVLLVKRCDYPFKDMWCLPGGFLNSSNETLEDCAKRILREETNLSKIYLEQLYTFDSLKRDPRCRVISSSYIALVDKNRLEGKLPFNASWFDIVLYDETKSSINVILSNKDITINFKVAKTLKEQTTDQYSFSIIENESLAFDHPLIIVSGIHRIRNKINYTDIVFNMLPEYFTLGRLQEVYEVILGKKLLDPAFRRIIKNKVVKTRKMEVGKGHRPSVLFRYNKNK